MDAVTLHEPRVDGSRILESLRDLLPEIRKRREEIEKTRMMPRDLIDRISSTGIFRMGVPRSLGGEQARLTQLMGAIETVATGDGSAGWCAMIATANGVTAGYMPDAGAREMFAYPEAPTAGIAAPTGAAVRVDGGVEVTGRWSFGSGITHCDWLWAGCLVMENGQPRMTPNGPEIIYTAMLTRELQIHDTWFVSGLSGTGSNDFSASGVFVPDRRIFDLIDPTGHRPEPLYQMPAIGTFASQLACVSLGIARAALDELVEIAQTKVPTLYNAALADRPATQIELARAEATLASARLLLFQSVDDIHDTLAMDRAPTPRQIAVNRMAALHAAEAGAQAARTANVLAGGSAIYAGSSLQRHARDAEVILHHFTVSPHTWEEAGRVLLGREPNVPIF
jgi:indole-3-acetate monooxygenase